MANEYTVNQSDMTSVANAIRAKGGTNAQLVFPSGFVTAIEGIPSGGVTVQRASGRVSLTGNNTTVNCGFRPDALFLTLNETYTYDDTTFQCCAGVLFNELQSGNEFDCALYGGDFKYIYEIWGSRTTLGFTAGYQRQTVSNSSTSSASKSFNYVAIKYT